MQKPFNPLPYALPSGISPIKLGNIAKFEKIL